MEAILLAGGLGTRLHSVTGDKYPKCLAEVNGKPFLHYILDDLTQQGVTRFVFALSHHAEMVRQEVSACYPHLDCAFSYETEPLGTGGAIKHAMQQVQSQYALVFNADSFMQVSIKDFVAFCHKKNASLGMVCTEVDDLSRFGAADIQQEKLVGFHEKGQSGAGYINAGIYYLSKHLPLIEQQPVKFSFEHNVLSAKDAQAYAYCVTGLFFDIGTPDDLVGASKLVKLNAELFVAN
ncbi:sugar phosphate nucleotidyltransferase [Alteromonas gilva]|uniref:Sugar phosphate nucleotidyltransferase n=1 Tax=Alteromonas gilva TaxID=2987522 RepID=A0ABT5KZX4_9ALTE|nr:sugar phosphate nucleotidyltransferase [Alteromonas gilva]MDC8830330.1 sugar phosphate nucleotidyltransferase [Alteromonas gilva]